MKRRAGAVKDGDARWEDGNELEMEVEEMNNEETTMEKDSETRE